MNTSTSLTAESFTTDAQGNYTAALPGGGTVTLTSPIAKLLIDMGRKQMQASR